jgi:hypothetical protein
MKRSIQSVFKLGLMVTLTDLQIIFKYRGIYSSFWKLRVVRFMVFNTTFNNISIISWWSVLLVEETVVPGENHRSVASHWQTLSHNVVHLALIKIRTHNISGDWFNTAALLKCLYQVKNMSSHAFVC